MITRSLILLVGVLVAAVGCRTVPNPHRDLTGKEIDHAPDLAVESVAHDVRRTGDSEDPDRNGKVDVIFPEYAETVAEQPNVRQERPLLHGPATMAAVPVADVPAIDSLESLEPDQLVADVLAVNPSVAAMESAWRAAAMQYPQVTALEDPMFEVALGPGSWGSNSVDSAYMVMASQKFPWPGKLELRGAVASAQANAASRDIQEVRLQLAEVTRLSYVDYWQSYRDRQLNLENIEEMRDFRETAEAKLRSNLVTQQDVLQADVELALLERRRLELDRRARVAAARINTLLHRNALHWLPPPPDRFDEMGEMPHVETLVDIALGQRPDLAAITDRIQADQAELALACKDYYPDFDAYAKYDAFWQESPLRPMIGVSLNVPLNQNRRHAAVQAAESHLHRHRAEYARLTDEIANQVHSIVEHWREAQLTVQLYETQIIPAAEKNVASAQAGYLSGRVDFLRLIDAQRQLIELREQRVEAEANMLSRRIEIQRAAALSPSM